MTPPDPAAIPLRRAHWMAPVLRIAGIVRSMWPLAALYLFDVGTREGPSLEARPLYLWIALVWIALGSLHALLAYAFHRYGFTSEGLVQYTGVLHRQDRRIPAREIREISEQQSLLQRALRLSTVRIHTAGGPSVAEVTLEHLSQGAVRELRAALSAPHPAAESADARPEPQGELLLRLGARDLVRIGLIENRGFVVLFAAYSVLNRVLDDWLSARASRALDWLLADLSGLLAGSPSWLAGVLELAVGTAVILVLLRILSISWNFYHRHGFTLRRVGGQLRTAQGLGVRRDEVVPVESIQLARVDASLLHRLAHSVSIRVTTSGGFAAGQAEGERALAPILPVARLEPFLQSAFARLSLEAGTWQRLPRRSQRRFAARFLATSSWPLLAIGVFAVPWGGAPGAWIAGVPFLGTLADWSPHALAALVACWAVGSLLAAALYAGAQRRYTAYRLGVETLQFRTGWLRRRTWIFPYESLHTLDLDESPFDRRHRMRSLSLAGAGGASVEIPFLDVRVATALHGRLLREVDRRRTRRPGAARGVS